MTIQNTTEASGPAPQTPPPPTPGLHHEHCSILRVLRCLGCMLLANPIALAVAVTCLSLLVRLAVGTDQQPGQQRAWSVLEVIRFIGINVVLIFLTCLACGHLALMWLIGWRGSEAED